MSDAAARWVDWVRRLQGIAQNGLTFALSDYDTERYTAVREIAAEMLAASTGAPVPVMRDLLGGDAGYATPKVDVRGVMFREDRILLVRERSDGCWTLPGGWADIGSSPVENVVREIREEAGFEARAVRLLAVLDRGKHPHPPLPFHVYKLFILCEITGGQATPSPETAAVSFFGESELPELSLGRVTAAQIRRMFEHLRNPGWPPDLD